MRTAPCLVALLTLVACHPPQINPRLVPEHPQPRWESGRAWVTQRRGPWTASVAFVEAGPDAYLFEVTASQSEGVPATLSPERIRFVIDVPEGCPEVTAEDPEPHIERLRQAEARERSTHAGEAAADLGLGLLDLALDLRPSSKAQERERAKAREERRQIDARHDALHRETLQNLTRAREGWEREALRRTTLVPGLEARGRVVVHRRIVTASRVSLHLPLGGETFVFPFAVAP